MATCIHGGHWDGINASSFECHSCRIADAESLRAKTATDTVMRNLREHQALTASMRAELEALHDDRKRALKRADALTLDTQTCDEAVASLVEMVRTGRAQLEAKGREIAQLHDAIMSMRGTGPAIRGEE